MLGVSKGMGSITETSEATPSDPIVPKSESIPDGYTSSSASTPEGDIGPVTQDVVQVQKRKGGRKPVHAMIPVAMTRGQLTLSGRYMPLRRSANKETGRHKLLFGNGAQNTSSSLKTPSSTMRILCKTYSRVTAAPLTSV